MIGLLGGFLGLSLKNEAKALALDAGRTAGKLRQAGFRLNFLIALFCQLMAVVSLSHGARTKRLIPHCTGMLWLLFSIAYFHMDFQSRRAEDYR